jgi:hypothetical protein
MGGVVSVDVGGVVTGVMDGLDNLFTSDAERDAARLKMQVELQKPHMMQAMANIHEAQHPNWFVAGWRPALGWLCVVLLAYAWIGRDFVIIGLSAADATATIKALPVIEAQEILTLVLALLGLGGLRTYEKMKWKARN